MKNTIKTELVQHILDRINDGVLTTENKDDWHFLCFNEDYYIIGYFEASKWLKRHSIGEFEAVEIVKEFELDHFGMFTTRINSESIVNMLAYIYGEELIYSFKAEEVEELELELIELLKED